MLKLLALSLISSALLIGNVVYSQGPTKGSGIPATSLTSPQTTNNVNKTTSPTVSTKAPCTASDCNTPIALGLTLGVQTCLSECNDDAGAVAGPDFNPPGQTDCYDFTTPTVWFEITTPAATATLDIDLSSPDLSDPYYAIFTSTNCINYTLYDCYTGSGGSAINTSNVPAGTTLLIAVSDYTGDVGDFTLCVTPQIDQSACNIASTISVTGTSMGSPAGGPYLPGEVVSFCYVIDTFDQQGCNWLQGVVPTFGNCWDPSSFQVTGEPNASTGIAAQGSFYDPDGAWNWWPAGSVTYNNLNNPNHPNGSDVGAGWFFSEDGSVDPDNSWGDGNGMGLMGDCDGPNSGLSWSVCFDLTATLNCATFIDCSVQFETFGDGEIGNWTQGGCVADQPDVMAAGILCCLLQVNAGTDSTICEGSSMVLDGSITGEDGATAVIWTSVPAGAVADLSDPTSLTPTYTPSGTGSVTFTLTVTDQSCTLANDVIITTSPTPTITGNAPICIGATVQLSGSGTPNGTTPWTSSNTGVATVSNTGLVTGVSAGTTDITYMDQFGCIVVETVTVNPTPTISGNAPICIGGTVQLTGTGTPNGATPWTSSNTGVATVNNTGLVTGVSAGTSTITYMDDNGCTNTVIVTVNPTPVISGNAPICIGATVQLSGTGIPDGATPWTSSNTGVATISNTGLVTGVSAGTTTITYLDNNGCSNTVIVTVNPDPIISGNAPICIGATVQLSGTGTPAAVNPWVSSIPGVATVSNTGLVTGVSAGTTTITYTDNAGCQTSVVVTVNPTPTISGNAPICIGATVQLTGTGTPNGATPWTSSNTGVATVDNAGLVTGVSAGTSTITYMDDAGCTNTVVVTVNPDPTIGGNAPICIGATVQLTGSGTPAGVDPWISSNTGVATVGSTGLVTGVSAGTSTITYTDANGCQNTVVVTVNPSPVINTTQTPLTGCNSNDGIINVTGGGATGTVTWTGPSSGSAVGVTLPYDITGLLPGTYDVTFIDGTTGCTSVISQETFANPGAPVIDPIGDTTSCGVPFELLNVDITGSGLTGGQAYYTATGGPGGAGSLIPNGTIYPAPTNITIYAFDENGACSSEESFTIIVNAIPTITGNTPICVGATVQLSGSGTPNGSTPWTSSNTGVATVSSTGLVTGIAAGSADITYTDINGCQNVVTVTVNGTPTISGNAPICVGFSVQLTGSGTPAVASPWTSSNTGVATVDNTGLVTGVAAGTSTITYTDINGCQNTVVVTVNATPTISGNAPICIGATVQLSGSGVPDGVTPWTSSNTGVATISNTGLVTGVSAGTSTITYTDNNGCQQTVVVTVNGTPTIGGNAPICIGSTVQLTGSGTPAVASPWVSSNPAVATVDNAGLVTGVSAGISTITYTDINGCQQTAVVTVNPTPTISGNAPICANGTVQLSGSGTPNGATPWVSSNTGVATVDNTGLVSGVAGGTTTITYTDVNGCQASVVVTVNALPTIVGNTPICIGATVQLTGSGTPDATTPWSTSVIGVATINNTGLVTGVSAGTTTITYTDVNGCQITEVVTVNPTPAINTAQTPLTGCNTNDGIITVSDAGGATGTVTWTGTAGGSAVGVTLPYGITGLAPGTYDVTFTDGTTGCTSTSSQEIFINPGAPTLDAIADQTVCDTYTLPQITGTGLSGSESCWSGQGATGTEYFQNDALTTTMWVYMYDMNGACSVEDSFYLTVNYTPVLDVVSDVTACESYALPAITGTNISGTEAYYNDSQANGGTVISGPITTTQTVWVYDANGACTDEFSFVVTIEPLPTVTSITGGGTYCEGDLITDIVVSVTGTPDWTINYTLDGAAQSMTGSTSPISLGTTAGVYVLVDITDANCTNSAAGTQTIVVNAIPNAPTAGTDATYCSTAPFADMTASGAGGSFTWYSDGALTNVLGTGTTIAPLNTTGVTVYYVTETLNDCEGPASQVTITIEECAIIVPTAFTPDGDMTNDDWEIVNIDAAYPENIVRVYNRWGNQLFESEQGNYDGSRWDGSYNGSLLPVGSYYYVIDFNDGSGEGDSGTVSIILNK